MDRKRRPLIAGALVAALGLTVGGLSMANASEDAPSSLCVTQAQALECVDGLRDYIESHPDVAPTAQPTTAAPTTTTAQPTTTTVAPTTTNAPPTITVPPTTVSADPTVKYASGLPWSSGVWSQHNASQATAFESMRGKPLDNISVFPSRDSWSSLLNTWYLSASTIPAGFKGDIVVAVPLWAQNTSVSANADANWQSFAKAVAAKDPDAYIRLGWEMNLPSSYWKVTAENRTAWIASFNRAVAQMHAVAPALRIVFNPNWGNDQTGTDSRGVFASVKSSVDVFGIDMYDSYPPDNSDANAAARLNGPRGMQDSLNFAKTNGVPFAFPEWGVACNGSGCQWQGNAGGDNPRYINDILSFMWTNRASMAFDSYFNEAESYIRSNLSPTSTNPNAAAAYKAKLAALT